jgi:hypothetical protein
MSERGVAAGGGDVHVEGSGVADRVVALVGVHASLDDAGSVADGHSGAGGGALGHFQVVAFGDAFGAARQVADQETELLRGVGGPVGEDGLGNRLMVGAPHRAM